MLQHTGRWRRTVRRGRVLSVCLLLLLADTARALVITNAYSPLNSKRAQRKSTRFILLHTTEGPGKGSLASLKRYGEAHYMIDRDGHVYRIIYRSRLAYHAGRSMWEGRTNLDLASIGIEMVGYHNKSITTAQTSALKELLAQLQRIYHIPDERVLTHSMVAYGSPNRWHRKSHRGRKRCGMCFARRSLRLQLGLERQPLHDPDVKAGRLVNGDPYLAKVLFGSSKEQV
jgi:N-acetyl-anhydromuramyl-L-alanine amidase AmpD